MASFETVAVYRCQLGHPSMRRTIPGKEPEPTMPCQTCTPANERAAKRQQPQVDATATFHAKRRIKSVKTEF